MSTCSMRNTPSADGSPLGISARMASLFRRRLKVFTPSFYQREPQPAVGLLMGFGVYTRHRCNTTPESVPSESGDLWVKAGKMGHHWRG